jgi:Tfp pilus assembly protein PilO
VKSRKISPKLATGLVVAGALVVLLAGMFALVMPQRHKASDLTAEIDKTNVQIATARALAAQKPEQERIRVADLFKVVEAMPDDPDMTGIILQLQQTAREAGVGFDSIQPQSQQAAGTGYSEQPIDLTFAGNYFSLTDFLFRLRKLVTVRHGELNATGRLFSVGKIAFAPGVKGFPSISATIRVSAYAYSPAAAAATTVPPASTDGTETTPSASSAVASGVAP